MAYDLIGFALESILAALKVALGVGLLSALLFVLVLVPFGLWITTLEWLAQYRRRRRAQKINFP